MIITRTPYRVSFFGGGTDYPAWFQQHGGRCLTSTINRYCYLSARWLPPFFDHRIRAVHSLVELVRNPVDISHPSIRACLQYININNGIEIHHFGDLPARSGMGSSSAFTVGLLHALHALEGRMVSKYRLAREAIHVEQDLLKEAVGIQDQIACAHGGLNVLDIAPSGDWTVSPVVLSPGRLEALQARLMLFYTGISRFASEVAAAQVDITPQRAGELSAVRILVDLAIRALVDGELDDFGRWLHESWLVKRSITGKISNPEIDAMYAAAIQAGALGGKLLGAGGGGFLLIYARPDDQPAVRAALNLLEVPFAFEHSGTQIIFADR